MSTHAWLKVTAVVLLSLVSTSAAQFQQDPNDFGAADTVDMVFSVIPDATTNQLHVQVDLWVFTDSNRIVGASSGFFWDNPNMLMDSASASSLTQAAFDQVFLFKGSDINLTNSDHQFVFGGFLISKPGVLPEAQRRLWGSYYFTLSNWNVSDSIVLDTVEFNTGSRFRFVGEGNLDYTPFWTGRKVVYDTAFTPPANLILAPDTLFFSGIEGQTNPASQQLSISSDGTPLSVSLTEAVSWLGVNPTVGTTPLDATVSISTLGLPAGLYFDSIEVAASGALNSPQYAYVSLEVVPPPPTIAVSPNALFFNAVAGSTNPPPKILTITNSGGSTLNWMLTNSQSWLSLFPISGVDSGDVSVDVDITGLPFGTYVDTIAVADPQATNTPVLIPVTLTIASDLPLIEADSTFNIYIIPLGTPVTFERTFVVRNAGGGTLNFWVEENSSRITSVDIGSGTAPETVTVHYKTSGVDGQVFLDTLTVFSNEAVNSPVTVVNELKFSSNPPVIEASVDTVAFTLYECAQGLAPNFFTSSFDVVDAAGGSFIPVFVSWDSDLFRVFTSGEFTPAGLTVMLDDSVAFAGIGTHLDTIVVSSFEAINYSDTVIARIDIVPGDQQPEIAPTDSSIVIAKQEGTLPTLADLFTVRNRFGGCMEWSVQEDIPWVVAVPDSGQVGQAVQGIIDVSAQTLGEYPDTLFIAAPGAVNSPFAVPVTLQVWRLRGDWNWNGVVDVSDLTLMIGYLFIPPGTQPQPTMEVGDVNCDGVVDVSDLTVLIDHLFINFPPLDCTP